MPVAHPEEHRDAQKIGESCCLLLRPGKQRRTAPNRGVALPDFFQNVWRPWPASANVTEVGFHVFHPLRSSVSEQKNPLPHGRYSRTISTTALTFSTGVSGKMP